MGLIGALQGKIPLFSRSQGIIRLFGSSGFLRQRFHAPLQLCGDNAAMIGSQAYYEYQAGPRGKTLQNAYATADIGKNICD